METVMLKQGSMSYVFIVASNAGQAMTWLSLFDRWVTHSSRLFPLSSNFPAQTWAITFQTTYTDRNR
jgi:hypothetical protein